MIYRVLFIHEFNKVRERFKRIFSNLSIWGQGGRNNIRLPTLNLLCKRIAWDWVIFNWSHNPARRARINHITLSRFPLVSRWSHMNSLYSCFRSFSTLIFSYLPVTHDQTKGRSSSPYSNTVILLPPPPLDLTNYPIFLTLLFSFEARKIGFTGI